MVSLVVESLTRLNIVMEYAAGGDMESRLQKKGVFNDTEGKLIFAQLLSAMRHLVSFVFFTWCSPEEL